ncbi:MAG: GGDEF domain-containing protein [Actinobacteria bacterium]|nr:GGDEF domain-containing protein [Actinomycetota bacterium]
MLNANNTGEPSGGVDQGSILIKARSILDEHKLDITKSWLSRLVGRLDDLEALERFPTQESIRTSVELIEGLIQCLADEEALAEFEVDGVFYKQAENLGMLQRDSSGAIGSLADNLAALEEAIWDRLAEGLRQQDQDVLQLVRILRLGLHRIMTAATAAYHHQSNAELNRLAHTDALTGLYNRRYWEPELARHVELYKRYRHPFAILMLDFDNLKWVNDTFGHAAGDTALIHLATVMRMSIRDVDIPCRFGGDEFLILMPEAEKNAIQMVGRRISESINKTRFKLGRSFASLQVSFGAAACPENGVEADVLLQEADANLYRAKQEKSEQHTAPSAP